MLRYFGCSQYTASSSAFIQQRQKINEFAFPSLFDLFVRNTDVARFYKGYRLLAADGSDIQIPANPNCTDSYFPGSNGQSPYSLLHLDALYDLLQHTYIDAAVCGRRNWNEKGVLCNMVDRSNIENALIVADRGYESYNLMAHIQEKGWEYLIRIKDIHSSGIASGLDLPDHDVFYSLPFRIVRFRISASAYETVVTNLNAEEFPPDELKRLYGMCWGIETSFRESKYTVGLLHFHAKKVENIT